MKKPPSASVSPPIHTTQRVPSVSSKPRSGSGSGGGGGVAVSPVVSCAVPACGGAAGAIDVTSGMTGGGAGAVTGETGAEVRSNACVGSGGGTGLATAIPAASNASNRLRSTAI